MTGAPSVYVLMPIDGLHLTCDFVIYRSALFGNEPDYVPSRVGLHDEFAHPYHYLSHLSFQQYLLPDLAVVLEADEESQRELRRVPDKRLKDFTCLMFELEEEEWVDLSLPGSQHNNNALLERVCLQADQILDVLRLYLFRPGEDRLIGQAGSMGGGVCGLWLGDEESVRFIARRVSPYALAQDPIDVSLNDVRHVYNDRVFQELCSAAHKHLDDLDSTLQRVFSALKAFRESRELQSWEARLRHLFTIAESLAKATPEQHLHGPALRQAVAEVASTCWDDGFRDQHSFPDVLDVVRDLWDNVRNAITHQLTNPVALRRDPQEDLYHMEHLVVSMLRSIVCHWQMDDALD